MHEGTRRRQAVLANEQGRDLTSFVEEAQRAVAKIQFPAGTYEVFRGASEARKQTQREILILLSIVFYNLMNMLLVLVNFRSRSLEEWSRRG